LDAAQGVRASIAEFGEKNWPIKTDGILFTVSLQNHSSLFNV